MQREHTLLLTAREVIAQQVEYFLIHLQHGVDVQVDLVQQPQDVAVLGVALLERQVVLAHVVELAVEQIVVDDSVE